MTIDKMPASLAEDSDAWEIAGFPCAGRKANLTKGFRFYTSADWFRWYRDGRRPGELGLTELSPAALTAQWRPETSLDLLIDGEDISQGGRYMTVTARLHRYYRIRFTFMDLVNGFAPHRLMPRRVRPIRLKNDGPTFTWLLVSTAIRSTLPKNDSDIFDRPSVTEKPKLGHLAEELKPLLDWRRMQQRILPSSTNWRQADNDNFTDDHADARPSVDAERRYRAGPKEETLIKMAGPVDMTFRHARLGGGGELDCLPLFPAKLGKLKVSNGSHVENGKRLPRGAIRHYEDEFTELLGAEPDLTETKRRQSYWTSLFGTARTLDDEFTKRELEPIEFKKGGRMRRKVLLTAAEQADILATQARPPVTYCKPGLPCGHEDIGAQFIGGWISQTKGVEPPERWQDVSDELARQAEFERWAAALPPEQRKALNLIVTAANFREVGEAFDRRGKNAERFGKKIVLAANDNLKKVMPA